MKYLLDTDTFSYVARDANALLTARFRGAAPQDLALSVISRGEIEFGLAAHSPKRLTLERALGLLEAVTTLPLAPAAASRYRDLRAHLHKRGTPIGANDMWIAAHALAEGLTVVTNNEREFRRVPGLMVENWMR